MCLQIPLRVEKINGNKIFTEGGRIFLNKGRKNVNVGDYIYGFGNLLVSTVSALEAKAAREILRKKRE